LSFSDTVRGVQRGWRFENPYYITLIEVQSQNGTIIDFGDQTVIIDHKGLTGPQHISGKTDFSDGVHEVRVHKNNWLHIEAGLNTLIELVSADKLYPYNHKLLIEGYSYGGSWLGESEKVYQGVDIFFERRMKQISLFDLSENLGAKNRYRYFALDRDIADTHTGGNSATRVFVVKVDNTNSDLFREEFRLRFNLVNQRYSYVRFKADLLTEVEDNCPVMGAYKLKFSD